MCPVNGTLYLSVTTATARFSCGRYLAASIHPSNSGYSSGKISLVLASLLASLLASDTSNPPFFGDFSRKMPSFREFPRSPPAYSKKFMPSSRLHALSFTLGTSQIGKAPALRARGLLHVGGESAVPGERVVLCQLRVVVNNGFDPVADWPGRVGLVFITQRLRHGTANDLTDGGSDGVFKSCAVTVDQVPAPPFLEVPLHRRPQGVTTHDALYREPACRCIA